MFNRKALIDFMEEKKISTSSLAKELGVTEGAIRHITSGLKQPSLVLAVRISEKMGRTVDSLIVKN